MISLKHYLVSILDLQQRSEITKATQERFRFKFPMAQMYTFK